MNFLVVPDTFKGSISSQTFCDIAQKVIVDKFPNSHSKYIPITDGGEGFVECMARINGADILSCHAIDSNFFKGSFKYAIGNKVAYIATSGCAGLANTLIKNPLYTTTYGLGEQIKLAKALNVKHIVLGLGGSSTNDAGVGLIAGLGGIFYDKDGNSFVPTGGTLSNIFKVDFSQFYLNIEGLSFTALCDVSNPLLGENGCSYIFAKQKGARLDDLPILEKNMTYWANFEGNKAYDNTCSGAGSAGGLGYCVKYFLGGEIKSGISYILDSINFSELCKSVDYVISGEGKVDNTSFMGKVCGGVSSKMSEKSKLVIFCGESEIKDKTSVKIIEINDKNISLEENLATTAQNLEVRMLEWLAEL